MEHLFHVLKLVYLYVLRIFVFLKVWVFSSYLLKTESMYELDSEIQNKFYCNCNDFFFTTLQHNQCGKMYNSVMILFIKLCFDCFQTIHRCVSFAHTTSIGFFFSTGETMKKYGIVATSFLICMIFIGIIVFIIR